MQVIAIGGVTPVTENKGFAPPQGLLAVGWYTKAVG